MITGFFITILTLVMNFIIAFLPTNVFPTSISSAIITIWSYINAMSFLFPVSTLLTVLGLALTFHVALMMWRLLHLIGGYIRGR